MHVHRLDAGVKTAEVTEQVVVELTARFIGVIDNGQGFTTARCSRTGAGAPTRRLVVALRDGVDGLRCEQAVDVFDVLEGRVVCVPDGRTLLECCGSSLRRIGLARTARRNGHDRNHMIGELLAIDLVWGRRSRRLRTAAASGESYDDELAGIHQICE